MTVGIIKAHCSAAYHSCSVLSYARTQERDQARRLILHRSGRLSEAIDFQAVISTDRLNGWQVLPWNSVKQGRKLGGGEGHPNGDSWLASIIQSLRAAGVGSRPTCVVRRQASKGGFCQNLPFAQGEAVWRRRAL